jgi:hypothetical protein
MNNQWSNLPVGEPVVLGAGGQACDTTTFADQSTPAAPRFTVTADADGTYRVTLDGHDLTTALRGVSFGVGAECTPYVELDLAAAAMDASFTPEAVHLTAPTRDALIALGWTPPAAPEGGPF